MTSPTALPIVIVASGGLKITESPSGIGLPVVQASNGRGVPCVLVASGGLAVVGSGNSA
jgi:hypothetical protein